LKFKKEIWEGPLHEEYLSFIIVIIIPSIGHNDLFNHIHVHVFKMDHSESLTIGDINQKELQQYI